MKTLYILELKDGKWYIGTTNRPLQDRIVEHFASAGAEWTKRYPPVKVVSTMKQVDDFEEDKQTKVYMHKYGIGAVRGGSYIQVELPDYQLQALTKELAAIDNLCFKCGEAGHYAAECKCSGCCYFENDCVDCADARIEKDGPYDVFMCATRYSACKVMNFLIEKYGLDPWYVSGMAKTAKAQQVLRDALPTCFVCKELGHSVSDCPKDLCYRCGRAGHLAFACYASTAVHRVFFPDKVCYRCGRESHLSPDCFAHKDIYDRPLD